MTTDPALQTLFAASEQRYDDEAFTQQVMKKSRFVRYRVRIIAISLLVVITGVVTFSSADAQFLIVQLNALLTADIIEMDEGLSSVALEPINTVASLLVIVGKLGHMLYKYVKR